MSAQDARGPPDMSGPAVARADEVGHRPALRLAVVFFLLPLALVLGLSLGTNAPDLAPPVELGVSFASYKLLFTDDLYLAAWLSSLRIAATSTAVTLLLGYPMAYA